jgi:hypothetical protein
MAAWNAGLWEPVVEERQTAIPREEINMDALRKLVFSGAAMWLLTGVASAANAPLSTVVNPPEKIADASIADESGKIVGAMQRVNLANGKPTSAEIALLGAQDHLVIVDAAQMTYDPASNIVTVQASPAELKAMAAKG